MRLRCQYPNVDAISECQTDSRVLSVCCYQVTVKSGAKLRAGTVDAVRRGKDEMRSRLRVRCKPPRSMYLNRDDLAAAVAAPSGIVHSETLVKMTESQLLALRRQASYHHSYTQRLLKL